MRQLVVFRIGANLQQETTFFENFDAKLFTAWGKHRAVSPMMRLLRPARTESQGCTRKLAAGFCLQCEMGPEQLWHHPSSVSCVRALQSMGEQ